MRNREQIGSNHPPASSWDFARALLAWLYHAFGTPAMVARRHYFPPRGREILIVWLQGLEAYVRRLLFIEAAFTEAPPAPRAKRTPGMSASHGRGGFANEDSSRWGVRFVLLPSARKRQQGGRGARARAPAEKTTPSPFPLAERLEALTRIIADPAPWRLRMARRLRSGRAAAKILLRDPRVKIRTPVQEGLAQLSPLAHKAFAALAPDTS